MPAPQKRRAEIGLKRAASIELPQCSSVTDPTNSIRTQCAENVRQRTPERFASAGEFNRRAAADQVATIARFLVPHARICEASRTGG